MKILFFLILYFINKISSDCEKLDLVYNEPYYYINLNFPQKDKKIHYILSTNIPKSFFPTNECEKCSETIIDNSNGTFQNSSKNISIPYYYYNFIGKEFNGSIYSDNYISKEYFCGFDNITYAENYGGRGRYALSFLNYNFNTSKKLFALKFNEEDAELHLGDYDKSNYHIKSADNFTVSIVHEYENYTEQIIHNKTNITENSIKNFFYENSNYLSELNDNNDTYIENRTIEIDKSQWFINFTKLKIKTDSEMDVDYPNSTFKLTLDTSSSRFYIPRIFFEKNVKKIFPQDAKCQLTRNGYFNCQCDEDYQTKFGSFVFETAEGTKFYVNVTDYMTYQSSITGSQCEVHVVINYDNDLFIGGTNVLNNYYSIFDIDNNILKILPKNDLSGQATTKFLIMFFAMLVGSVLILFGGYYFYNKFVINEPTGVVQQNNNNEQNNNNIEQN